MSTTINTAPDNDVELLQVNCTKYGLGFRSLTPGDGNCFFHAVLDQCQRLGIQIQTKFPNATVHELRAQTVCWMSDHRHIQGEDGSVDYKDYIEGDWEQYLSSMRRKSTWADHAVVSAMAHMLRRPIIIVTSTASTIEGEVLREIRPPHIGEPLLLGLVGERHYQSLKPDYADDQALSITDGLSISSFDFSDGSSQGSRDYDQTAIQGEIYKIVRFRGQSLGMNIVSTGIDHGVLVSKLEEGWAAWRAGIRTGDIIIAINNKQLTRTDGKTSKSAVSRAVKAFKKADNVILVHIIRKEPTQNPP